MRRPLTALLVVAGTVLAAGSQARADSLVFIDQGGDVAIARPDGGAVRKVTHASSPDSGYRAPSVADDGLITAFLRQRDDGGNSTLVALGTDGTVRQGPFLFPRSGICGGLSPFRTATSPDGAFVAAQYWKGSNTCLGSSPTPSVRLVTRNAATPSPDTYPSYDYLTEPRWVRHPDVRLAGINGGTLSVWQNDATKMEPWLALPVDSPYRLAGFDIHPTQTRLLLDLGPASGTGVQPHRLELYSYTEMSTGDAPPTDPNPQLLCATDGYVSNDTGGGRPIWSRDGTQIAWTGPEGIFVSPAPVPDGGTCRLQPRLVVPGAGPDVAWAPFDVSDPAAPGGSPSGGGTAGPGAPSGTGGSASSGPAFKGATVTAARRGFALRLTVTRATTVTVTITRRGARKALGVLRYRARKGTFRRTITRVRGKRLTRGRYRIVVRAGTTSRTLQVRVRRPAR
ncbi:hypothetical protein SK069_06610 [Patulibacter brassicae]|uniref:Uncharacterized protein n=1 Tax=Patulibacter brassicae TaxID=1705717 RepID=A0ABU4VHH0_9ACTN|nr:hypothetical protein [Patulibacter brassicae]MDX8151254.1 hypothetical protein [Patulibacter brassicae]